VPEDGFHLLTRAMNDRRLAGSDLLFATMAGLPMVGQRTIDLPAREPGRAARTAKLELRFGTVEIMRPNGEWDRSLARTVTLQAIEVREIEAPPNVEPLHWRLLTTHTIANAAAAWCIVDWYRLRWTIEQLFRVLKSQGLQLEDSQVTSAERLTKLAAVATKAACIDIHLTQARDGKAGLPASTVFSEAEIETLAVLGPTLEGKTERQRNPHPVRSLAAASWIIARLGGWNCYYKPPGPITMRRSMEQFHAIHRGRQLDRDRRSRIIAAMRSENPLAAAMGPPAENSMPQIAGHLVPLSRLAAELRGSVSNPANVPNYRHIYKQVLDGIIERSLSGPNITLHPRTCQRSQHTWV
jgi:hypothetical protein